ncbi:4-amino-4-deoxychorismate lyase [Lottiidibacillus patelloidae]|uniref:4-amino-4-deoxychorismate lyase n=1 Tax=Lottiidibacillus patelloidae TaxID=2670334 RepID=A0A263BQH3_9BACI|nr:aminodeoxychorismate lyase [Lottiidibacillus patelloidae]OZM55822.1 4-amino-4-deoxychorismate lyase [Lottiidibacillus patelloidae]
MYVYLNGQIVKEEEATISIFEHGFMYGLGVFETLRVYEGHPFLFHDHMERMARSLKQVGIIMPEKWQKELLSNLIILLEANNYKNAYVRINISAGAGSLGLQVEPYVSPTIIIYSKPMPVLSNNLQGKHLQLLKTRRNTPEGPDRIKSHHFLNNVIGKREVGECTNIEGLFLTKDGFVAEGVVSNIFWVKDGVLYTPALSTGILGGITRGFILCLANKLEIPYRVGKFKLEHLLNCEEAFVTNSIQEIVPIKGIEKMKFTAKNELTEMFKENYEKHRTSLWSTVNI